MTPEMLLILKNEILNDPIKRGYDIKDIPKTVELLNSSFQQIIVPEQKLKNQIIKWSDVRSIAQSAGEWPNIILRAEERPITQENMNLVKAAINAKGMGLDQIIDPNHPKAVYVFEMGLFLFRNSGDISDETANAINALSTVTIPSVTEEKHSRIFQIFIENPVEFPEDFTSYAATEKDVMEALAL